MKTPQAVFFDFDGVILDSVDVKTQAFTTLFRPYGTAIEEAAVAYHLQNGGLSRYEKFSWIYHHLLHQPLSETDSQQLGEQFRRLVQQKLLQADFIPGALATLQQLHEQGIKAFVVSGTPENELKQLIESRHLQDFFTEVHGSPRTKISILQDLLLHYRLAPEHCWFLGDAMTDYHAAVQHRIPFLGIVRSNSISPFPDGTLLAEEVFCPNLK